MNVPFLDLKKQYGENKRVYQHIFTTTFSRGNFVGGRDVNVFERKFASFIGTRYAVSLNSGTDALLLGAKALSFSPTDEIIFPAFTYYATLLTATWHGIKPVLVEMDEHDFGIDLDDLKKKITKRTKAIVVVHLYGQPDKIGEIQSIVKKRGRKIHIIEDACQAHGATYHGRKVGSFGTFSAFSFYPTKNLGAFGDGGMVTTNSAQVAKQLCTLKDYGQSKKYHHESLGINSRLDTLQAAFLSFKLTKLISWNKARQNHALLYNRLLSGITQVKTPLVHEERKSVFHLYVIRAKQRDQLQKYLQKKGVGTLIHYPVPIHLQKAHAFLRYKKGAFPKTEQATKEILSLPMYPELKTSQIEYVAQSIKKFYS